MAERKVKIWYDPEGYYLEVIFDQRPGYFHETENDQVIEKIDAGRKHTRLLGAQGERSKQETLGSRALTREDGEPTGEPTDGLRRSPCSHLRRLRAGAGEGQPRKE